MLSFEIVLGGDQSKWKIGGVKCVSFVILYMFNYYSVDIAENSIEDCRRRYREKNCRYEANFYAFDCTKVCF
jgi:hypothetical protein